MARVTCTIEGYIAAAGTKVTATGKEFYEIRLSTGSKKKDDGTYDNSRQVWWNLKAWGDYAQKLKFEDSFEKGDYIRATVQNPEPKVYQTKDGRFTASMQAPLWNYSLAKVHFLPKSPTRPEDEFYDNAPFPEEPEFDDHGGQPDIPF